MITGHKAGDELFVVRRKHFLDAGVPGDVITRRAEDTHSSLIRDGRNGYFWGLRFPVTCAYISAVHTCCDKPE